MTVPVPDSEGSEQHFQAGGHASCTLFDENKVSVIFKERGYLHILLVLQVKFFKHAFRHSISPSSSPSLLVKLELVEYPVRPY